MYRINYFVSSILVDQEREKKKAARRMTSLKEAVSILKNHGIPFPICDLPNMVSDPLWDEICTMYNLTLSQVSALKKQYCSPENQSILLEIRKTIDDIDKRTKAILKQTMQNLILGWK